MNNKMGNIETHGPIQYQLPNIMGGWGGRGKKKGGGHEK